MILQHIQSLNSHRIVLASASPRRKEILENIGLKFEVVPSTFEEDLPHTQFTPPEYARATATEKAKDVSSKHPDARIVIAADTVVEKDGRILEKANDDAEATRMLSMLSGAEHRVHTGVVLVTRPEAGEPLVTAFSETTRVRFAAVGDAEISAYIATGDCWGKAGSYGIQRAAGAWVEWIEGCYFNVMGFPVHRFSRCVAELLADGKLKLT